MNILKAYNVELLQSFNKSKNLRSGLYIIDDLKSSIDLNSVIYGENVILQDLSNFTKSTNSTLILFSQIKYIDVSLGESAFIFDKGVFLGLSEPYKEMKENQITVFDTFFGRVGVIFEQDIYQNNIFYLYESLYVDFLVIKCKEIDVAYICNEIGTMPCIFVVNEKILFNNM